MTSFDTIAHLIHDPVRQALALPQRKNDPLPGLTFLTPRRKAIPSLIYTPREVKGFINVSRTTRVNAALLPRMCFEVVKRGASDSEHPDTVILLGLFTDAMCEAVAGMSEQETLEFGHHLNEVTDSVFHKHKGGWFDEEWTNGKIGMCLFFLACDLTQEGFELAEGSALADGLQRLWTAVEDEAAAYPDRAKSAEKQAVKFRRFLQKKGLFR